MENKICYFVPVSQIKVGYEASFVSVKIEDCPQLFGKQERAVREILDHELQVYEGNGQFFCYYKNGEFKKALREFQNSIDLDPTLNEAYDNKRAARASYEESIQGRNSKF
jgi:tetratricopeptide (TPR) repeat protein